MKLALRLALAGTAAVAVGAAGLTSVAAASPGTPAPAAAQPQPKHSAAHPLTAAQRTELRRTGHVHTVLHTRKHGDVPLDLRAGTVSAVTPTSVTVLSKDGTSATFSTDGTTKVRSRRAPVTVHQGDRVVVIASNDKARRIAVRPAVKHAPGRKPAAPTSTRGTGATTPA